MLKRSMQTPDHGIQFDADSAVKSTPSGSVIPFQVGWFKTMIEYTAQIETVKWPDYSQKGKEEVKCSICPETVKSRWDQTRRC